MLSRITQIVWIIVLVIVSSLTGWLLWNNLFPEEEEQFSINTDQATVVKEIRELSRLETTTFTLEKIIEADTQTNESSPFQDFFVGDRLLLIAHGQVIAGFDLQTISEDAIQIEGTSIQIEMPAPEILVSRLDNEKTRVYDRDTGIFVRQDPELESEARVAAENSIREGACEADILGQATLSGEKQITILLEAFGFEEVSIQIPEGQCI